MKASEEVKNLEHKLVMAEKTINKIWDRVNGSDGDEKTYWAVLNIVAKYREH